MQFTKSDDVYFCEDADDITAEDKLCGVLEKGKDGYWRWHTPRRIQLTCKQMKCIAEELSRLNRGGE